VVVVVSGDAATAVPPKSRSSPPARTPANTRRSMLPPDDQAPGTGRGRPTGGGRPRRDGQLTPVPPERTPARRSSGGRTLSAELQRMHQRAFRLRLIGLRNNLPVAGSRDDRPLGTGMNTVPATAPIARYGANLGGRGKGIPELVDEGARAIVSTRSATGIPIAVGPSGDPAGGEEMIRGDPGQQAVRAVLRGTAGRLRTHHRRDEGRVGQRLALPPATVEPQPAQRLEVVRRQPQEPCPEGDPVGVPHPVRPRSPAAGTARARRPRRPPPRARR
jgi:hypothetical protein